jgi:hypothetical protein
MVAAALTVALQLCLATLLLLQPLLLLLLLMKVELVYEFMHTIQTAAV